MTFPRTTRRMRRLMQAFIGLALLVFAAWLLPQITANGASRRPAATGPEEPSAVQTQAGGQNDDEANAKPVPAVAKPTPGQTPTPTPPDPSALAARFNHLAARARAGDAEAAMQLHRGTMRCRQLQRTQALARPIDLAAVRAAKEPWQLQAQAMACLDRPLCAGITATQLRDPTQWLVRAAQAGDRDARAWLATGLALQWNGLDAMAYAPVLREHGQIRPDAAACWRRSSPKIRCAATVCCSP